jgi:hypothetical protein
MLFPIDRPPEIRGANHVTLIGKSIPDIEVLVNIRGLQIRRAIRADPGKIRDLDAGVRVQQCKSIGDPIAWMIRKAVPGKMQKKVRSA